MMTLRTARAWLAGLLFLMFAVALPAGAQGVDCAKCHANIAKKKFVHGAVEIGCKSCHDQLDASTEPHKIKGKAPKGLSDVPPALCEDCHERKLFQGKFAHAPVADGQCSTCHDPHASDNIAMLKKDPATLCLDCHADVRTKPHMIVGFSGGGHPLGDARKDKEPQDPLRAGKPFYCVACHEPHRGDRPKLTRFDKGMGSCQRCHKM